MKAKTSLIREAFARNAQKKDNEDATMASLSDLHQCYQEAVQNPKKEIINLLKLYNDMRSMSSLECTPPHLLREDFCGTAILCAEWVQRHVKNEAVGVDLDPKVLDYGREHFVNGSIADRISLHCGNVFNIDNAQIPKADLTVALNYGTCYFHSFAVLVRYMRQALASLKPGGVFICDGFGGQRSLHEKWTFRRKCTSFDYTFEQLPVDILTNVSVCRIGFKYADGSVRKAAFEYHFRLWSVADLRDAMHQAGFVNIQVWISSSSEDDDLDGDAFVRIEKPNYAPKADSWNVYIAGVAPFTTVYSS